MIGHRRARAATAAGVALLLLAGCGRKSGGAGPDTAGRRGPDVASGQGAASGAEADQSKLNDYVSAYNDLTGTFSLEEMYQQYVDQHVQQKTGNDEVRISALDTDVTLLKSARASAGSVPAVDAAADRLLAVMAPLSEQSAGLDAYYKSRGQLVDGFARGKREDPQVISRYQQALALLAPFGTAIGAERDRRTTLELAQLKRDGDTVGFDHVSAMRAAKALLALCETEADLHDASKRPRREALTAQIQQLLADEDRAQSKAAVGGEPLRSLRDSAYKRAGGDLQEMIGHYRDLERSAAPDDQKAMVASFNSAVESSNQAL